MFQFCCTIYISLNFFFAYRFSFYLIYRLPICSWHDNGSIPSKFLWLISAIYVNQVPDFRDVESAQFLFEVSSHPINSGSLMPSAPSLSARTKKCSYYLIY